MTMTSVLAIQSSWVLVAAKHARDSAARGGDGVPVNSLAAILLATVAAEAFINELPAVIMMNRDAPHLKGKIPRQFVEVADVLFDLEEERGQLKLKYRIAALVLGRPFDQGVRPFQDFNALVSLRNDLMHLKPDRDKWIPMTDAAPARVKWPWYVSLLESRGFTNPRRRPGAYMPSLDALLTPRVAAWACETTEQMVNTILSAFLDEGSSGLIHAIHEAWRHHRLTFKKENERRTE